MVSIYLNEVITIRDKDWQTLAPFYQIPEQNEYIDKEKIRLKKMQEQTKFVLAEEDKHL